MSRFVRTEAGRVLKLVDDPSVRMLELVDGAWVKPGEPPIQFSDLWGAERLSEDEVTKLVKSAKKVAKTPRYVRTEDGRVFEIADTSPMLRELVSGEWVKPAVPVFGGELMDATPLSPAEIASIRVREIEESAEARTEEMLDRLIEKRMKRSQATTPTTTTPSAEPPTQDTRKNEEVPTEGKVKTWLKAKNNVPLWAFSKYFPVGCLVCVTPGNVFSFGGNTLEFIATALFYAFIAFVFTEAVDHMLGENATNLRRIKAIAAEVVFAAAMFWWLID